MINFNPNLPPNDSLKPWEIEDRVAQLNAQIRKSAEEAYKTGGVPDKAAERAAKHSSITRQTPEAKKDRRDATTWWIAKNGCEWEEDDE